MRTSALDFDRMSLRRLFAKGMSLFAVVLSFLTINVCMIGYFQNIKRST